MGSLADLLSKFPFAQVEVVKTFTQRKTGHKIEVKEVGYAGLILGISVATRGIETRFHQFYDSDTA